MATAHANDPHLHRRSDGKTGARQNRFLPWRTRSNTTTATASSHGFFLHQSRSQTQLSNGSSTNLVLFPTEAVPAMPSPVENFSAPRRQSPGKEKSPTPLNAALGHTRASSKPELWPSALRIAKPTSPTRSDHESVHRESPVELSDTRSVDHMTTASNSMRDDLSTHSAASSRTSSRSILGFDSAAPSLDERDSFSDGLGIYIATATAMVMPAPGDAAVKRAAPVQPSGPPPAVPAFHRPSGSRDWTTLTSQLSPVTPPATVKIPADPPSPAPSSSDMPTGSVRASFGTVTNVTSTVYKGIQLERPAAPPNTLTPPLGAFDLRFPDTSFSRQEARLTQILASPLPELATEAPSKPLPPRPTMSRRSMSADGSPRRLPKSKSSTELPVLTKSAATASSPDLFRMAFPLSSPPSPAPDKTVIISDKIRKLNVQSDTYHERCAALRQRRQMLHSDILLALQDGSARPKVARSALQLQLDMANVNAGLDDCMTKLSHIEKQRQGFVDELLQHVQHDRTITTQAPLPLFVGKQSMECKQDSLSDVTVLLSPTSPAMPMSPVSPIITMSPISPVMTMSPTSPVGSASPTSPALLSPLSMSPTKFAEGQIQKHLPLPPPRTDVRASHASLSLANIMDFLDSAADTTEEPPVF